jgi:type II secretory pathway component GspD/PulD (secretin)
VSTEAQYTTSIQWQDTGVKMGVTALKIHKDNMVTVEIELEVTSITSYTSEGYPRVRTKAAKTALRLNDSETIVMGGLINNEASKVINKTPFLSDIPVIGKLFTREDTKKSDTEIVMFVTPSIISGNWDPDKDSDAHKRFGSAVSDVVSEKFKVIEIPAEKRWNKERKKESESSLNESKSVADHKNKDNGAKNANVKDANVKDVNVKDKLFKDKRAGVSRIFDELKAKYGIK